MGQKNVPVSVNQCCWGLLQLLCYGFIVSQGSFLSFQGENHPDPKSSQDLDPDKLRCTTSCQGDETARFSGF